MGATQFHLSEFESRSGRTSVVQPHRYDSLKRSPGGLRITSGAGVRSGLHGARAGGQRTVLARVSRRSGSGRRQVQRQVYEHMSFEESCIDEVHVYRDIRELAMQYGPIRRAAAARQAPAPCRAEPSSQVIVNVCLSAFRRRQGACALLLSDVADCATEGEVSARCLGHAMQCALDALPIAELARLERTTLLGLQKTAKRTCVQVRLEARRSRRKRLTLEGHLLSNSRGATRLDRHGPSDRRPAGPHFREARC